jgi:hypothetical protein
MKLKYIEEVLRVKKIDKLNLSIFHLSIFHHSTFSTEMKLKYIEEVLRVKKIIDKFNLSIFHHLTFLSIFILRLEIEMPLVIFYELL